jgi:hypothetical protein
MLSLLWLLILEGQNRLYIAKYKRFALKMVRIGGGKRTRETTPIAKFFAPKAARIDYATRKFFAWILRNRADATRR